MSRTKQAVKTSRGELLLVCFLQHPALARVGTQPWTTLQAASRPGMAASRRQRLATPCAHALLRSAFFPPCLFLLHSLIRAFILLLLRSLHLSPSLNFIRSTAIFHAHCCFFVRQVTVCDRMQKPGTSIVLSNYLSN